MESAIQLLSDETINQIAAGEVIESPASVVKELVENALDAGAKKIVVEVVGGGLQKIAVSDDGFGMNAEEAKLSIVRHATSKITKAQDLFHISSKGFRGEALASIASISQMTIETAKEGATGVKLEIERGERVKEGKCARTKGTTFVVKNLFHNVPARKRFQKSPPAISAEIFRLMTMLCLSHPSVQFELLSSGKKAIQTGPNETLADRARLLLGDAFAQNALPLEFEQGPLHFFGLIGAPSNSRPNRMSQYLFLNGRGVQCDILVDAIRNGYGTRLEERRHPLFLLHLNVPADLVDVNVHPQKLHIRLRQEELFVNKLGEAVEIALGKQAPIVSPFSPIDVDFNDAPLRFKEEVEPAQDLLFLPDEPVKIYEQIDRFLFLKQNEKLVLIDVEAASFRILYEKLIESMETKMEKQGLLVPFNVDLTPVESTMILTHQGAIEQMGFSLRAIGKDVFMVEALPPFIEEDSVKEILSEMARALQQFIGKGDYESKRRKSLAYQLAQRGKVKRVTGHLEAKRLLERLESCQNQTHCPKGNPTRIELGYDTIEHLFRKNQKTCSES